MVVVAVKPNGVFKKNNNNSRGAFRVGANPRYALASACVAKSIKIFHSSDTRARNAAGLSVDRRRGARVGIFLV